MAHLALKTLTAVAASVAAIAATAQSLPTPAFDPSGAGADMMAPGVEPVPAPTSVAPPPADTRGYRPLAPIPMHQHDALPLDGCYPAVTESSGTWLKRGLWYADIEAVIMSRTWDSDGATLFQEFDLIQNQFLTNLQPFVIPNARVVQRQRLGESSPGYDPTARLSLGRFLFRDQTNRDHTFEVVGWGGPEWEDRLGAEAQLTDIAGVDGAVEDTGLIGRQAGQIFRNEQGLHTTVDGSTPLDVDDVRAFTSFDRAQTMETDYTSRFHSWEANYNVAQRMRKDRMELQPSGEWIRRASPGISWDYTAGLRYFDVEERLDWFATDIDSIRETQGQTGDDINGAYNIQASNNLFGLQFGVGMTYQTDRWNVTVSTKQGVYINDARATTNLQYFDGNEDTAAQTALNNYSTDLHENGLSYLGTGSIMARYHLRPNLSLRAGWEFMLVTGLALAPNQADFNPAVRQLHLTGDAFYHGLSAGTEYYW